MFLVSIFFLCVGLFHNHLAADDPRPRYYMDNPGSKGNEEQQVEQDIKLLLQVGFFYGTKSDYPLETYCRNDGVGKKECCRILLTELCNNLKTEIMKNRVQCFYKDTFNDSLVL
jgi:hypothetical protein